MNGASTNVGSIHYDLKLDTSSFEKSARDIKGKLSGLGDGLKSVGTSMTKFVTLPLVAGFGVAVKAASDLNETINKVDVSFKDQADAVKEWSKTSIKSMGLAQQSALDAAALYGDMSTAMGLTTEQAKDMSTGLVQLGADMASFKNISFERSQLALTGIYTGETEALKHLGIVMTEANLAAYAQSKGITKNIQDMTQAEKVQLRYAYVMSVTTNAHGDFARTSDSTANRIRATRERFKELSAQIGQDLLPTINRLLEFLGSLMDRFNRLSPGQQDMIIKLGLIAAAVGPVLVGLGMMANGLNGLITLYGTITASSIPGTIASLATLNTALISFAGWGIFLAAALFAFSQIMKSIDQLKYELDAVNAATVDLGQSQDEYRKSLKSALDAGRIDKSTYDARLKKYNASMDEGQRSIAGLRAAGGPVTAGKSYIVGEKGPEVFTAKGDGTITPNHKLGGGITINIGTINDRADVDYLLRRLDRNQERVALGVSAA